MWSCDHVSTCLRVIVEPGVVEGIPLRHPVLHKQPQLRRLRQTRRTRPLIGQCWQYSLLIGQPRAFKATENGADGRRDNEWVWRSPFNFIIPPVVAECFNISWSDLELRRRNPITKKHWYIPGETIFKITRAWWREQNTIGWRLSAETWFWKWDNFKASSQETQSGLCHASWPAPRHNCHDCHVVSRPILITVVTGSLVAVSPDLSQNHNNSFVSQNRNHHRNNSYAVSHSLKSTVMKLTRYYLFPLFCIEWYWWTDDVFIARPGPDWCMPRCQIDLMIISRCVVPGVTEGHANNVTICAGMWWW